MKEPAAVTALQGGHGGAALRPPEQYQPGQQYPAGGAYDQAYQADPYQGGQYDPYAYGGQAHPGAYDPSYDQTYQQGYDGTYDPEQQQPHGSERSDGSQQ